MKPVNLQPLRYPGFWFRNQQDSLVGSNTILIEILKVGIWGFWILQLLVPGHVLYMPISRKFIFWTKSWNIQKPHIPTASIIFDIMSEKKKCVSAENCTGYYQAIAYDLDCIQKHPTVCQVLRCLLLNCFSNKKSKQERYLWSQDIVSQFWLRGLCSSSTLDTVYKLRQDLSQVIINHHEM